MLLYIVKAVFVMRIILLFLKGSFELLTIHIGFSKNGTTITLRIRLKMTETAATLMHLSIILYTIAASQTY